MSEALKSNTTLTLFNLWSKDKRMKTHKRHPSTIHSVLFLFTSTDNDISDELIIMISKAVQRNKDETNQNRDPVKSALQVVKPTEHRSEDKQDNENQSESSSE